MVLRLLKGSKSELISRDSCVTFSKMNITTFLFGSNSWFLGSGCGSVGRTVASDIRGPRFESNFYTEHLLTVNCIEKRK